MSKRALRSNNINSNNYNENNSSDKSEAELSPPQNKRVRMELNRIISSTNFSIPTPTTKTTTLTIATPTLTPMSAIPNKEPFNIADVPFDCLRHVFAQVNIWHHNRLRAICKHFQNAHNWYLQHEMQKAIYEFKQKREKNVSAAILRSIQHATQVYVSIGYENIMYNCLLPLLRRAYRTPFDLENHNIKAFLTSFFKSVDKGMENPNSHYALVLYMMTLLSLLKSFRGYEFTATEKDHHLWLSILVPDIWMGTLFRRTIPGREKCNAILVILTLLLIGSISMQALKYVYEFEQEVFLFGSDAADGANDAKTEFKINIRGSEKVRSFINKWMHGSGTDQEFDFPDNLSAEKFQFDVKIACKSASHWGCPPNQILHIVPS